MPLKTIGIGISDPAKRKQQLIIMRVKRKVAQAMWLIGTFGLGTKNGIVYGNDEGEGFGVNRIRKRREKEVVIAMGDELCERERERESVLPFNLGFG